MPRTSKVVLGPPKRIGNYVYTITGTAHVKFSKLWSERDVKYEVWANTEHDALNAVLDHLVKDLGAVDADRVPDDPPKIRYREVPTDQYMKLLPEDIAPRLL